MESEIKKADRCVSAGEAGTSEVTARLTNDPEVKLPWADSNGGRCAPLPSHEEVRRIIALCRRLIFPGYFGSPNVNTSNLPFYTGIAVDDLYHQLRKQIAAALEFQTAEKCSLDTLAAAKSMEFCRSLPRLRALLRGDAHATYLGDPAAVSVEEVIFCYPGLLATLNHRVAHLLLKLGVPVIPRMISEAAHSDTGIDIHPGATIGERFVIDHGTGVVIGATAIIGDDVKLYQGVTLGAKSFTTDENNNPVKGLPRHPVIGNGVVIYANTTVLGRIHIGDGAVIGGNLWITDDVGPGEKLVQAKPDNILRFK